MHEFIVCITHSGCTPVPLTMQIVSEYSNYDASVSNVVVSNDLDSEAIIALLLTLVVVVFDRSSLKGAYMYIYHIIDFLFFIFSRSQARTCTPSALDLHD